MGSIETVAEDFFGGLGVCDGAAHWRRHDTS